MIKYIPIWILKFQAYETLSQIKHRNSKYWHWAKHLRETVEIYGKIAKNEDMNPPFYTGISCVMTMQSFSMRLCAPTSTSVCLAVAIKFGGDNGQILQLNTKDMLYGNSTYLRGLDVSWISQFKEEDERYLHILFFILYGR